MKKIPILNARIQGEGPTIVLLHGFLSSSEYWKQVSELTAKNNKVIALDLLGFGKSPKPRNSRYDYDAHIASIEATLQKLNVIEPFTLVGHSMGSLIALRYARKYENRISKLLLVNMPVMLGRREVQSEILNTSIVYKYGLRPYTHRFAWALFKTLFRLRLLSRQNVNRLRQNKYFFEHSPLSRIRSFQRVITDARTDIDLNMVRVKTLVLSGIEDRKVYIDNLSENITLSPMVKIENVQTGHHIPCAMPNLIVNRLAN